MNDIGARENPRIPTEIENIKELNERLIVNPKNAIINIACHIRIVVKRLLQLIAPVL
jgi:hypothetical protein